MTNKNYNDSIATVATLWNIQNETNCSGNCFECFAARSFGKKVCRKVAFNNGFIKTSRKVA